jgi:hypothetical protein
MQSRRIETPEWLGSSSSRGMPPVSLVVIDQIDIRGSALLDAENDASVRAYRMRQYPRRSAAAHRGGAGSAMSKPILTPLTCRTPTGPRLSVARRCPLFVAHYMSASVVDGPVGVVGNARHYPQIHRARRHAANRSRPSAPSDSYRSRSPAKMPLTDPQKLHSLHKAQSPASIPLQRVHISRHSYLGSHPDPRFGTPPKTGHRLLPNPDIPSATDTTARCCWHRLPYAVRLTKRDYARAPQGALLSGVELGALRESEPHF